MSIYVQQCFDSIVDHEYLLSTCYSFPIDKFSTGSEVVIVGVPIESQQYMHY